MMGPLQASWGKYAERVIAAHANDVQIGEAKLAFYAGACALMNLVVGAAEMEYPAGPNQLEVVSNEIKAFMLEYGRTGQVP